MPDMRHQLNIFTVFLILGTTLSPFAASAQNLESTTAARERARQADAEVLATKTYSSAQKSLDRAVKFSEKDRSPEKVTAMINDLLDY